MTARMATTTVPALLMPATTSENGRLAASRPATPVATLPSSPGSQAVTGTYGLARIDYRGRVADAAVERALAWAPGTRLHIHETDGVIIVTPDEQGVFTVPGQGHLYLPLPVRRWCRLGAGDQVLLIVGPHVDRLLVCPVAKLDVLLAAWLPAMLGGVR